MFCRTIMYQARATCSKHLRNKIQFRAYRTVEYRQMRACSVFVLDGSIIGRKNIAVESCGGGWRHSSKEKVSIILHIYRHTQSRSLTSTYLFDNTHKTFHFAFLHIPSVKKQKERKTTSNNRLRQKQATKQQKCQHGGSSSNNKT